MRKFGGKWVLGIFSVFIMASFGFWGIGDVIRGLLSSSANAVAFVGDAEVSANELDREYRRFRALFGGGLDSVQAREMGLLERSLDIILSRMLYDMESERLGLLISDEMVLATIQRTPQFQDVRGDFDRNIFASTLAAQRTSEQQYVEKLRDEIRRNQIIGSLIGSATVPDALFDEIYRFRNERRAIETFTITSDSVGDVAAPDETTLDAFHQRNALSYTAPEYRKVTFIQLTPEEMADEVSVSDEDLQVEYEARQGEFLTLETRTVDQIVVDDEAAAQSIVDALREGRDFITVAQDKADMDAEAVSLGDLTRTDLFGAAVDAVFDLDAGGISAPVETPFGWHIFRVTAISPEYMQPLDEVAERLARDIALGAAIDLIYDMSNRLDDTIAGGATLEDAADSLILRLGQVDAIDTNGNTPEGSAAVGYPGGNGFIAAAFDAPEGETSLMIEAADGGAFMLRVDGVVPPTLRPLATVRDEVLADWQVEQRRAAVAEQAERAAESVANGEAMASAAKSFGLVPTLGATVRRDGDGAGDALSSELVRGVFTLALGGAVAGPNRDGSGYSVARLTDIIETAPQAGAEGVDEAKEQLRQGMVNDILGQYRQYLETRFPVRVNSNAIDAMF